MRVMVLVKASEESEAGVMPSEQLLADMGRYNEAGEGWRAARRRGASAELEGRARPVLGNEADRD